MENVKSKRFVVTAVIIAMIVTFVAGTSLGNDDIYAASKKMKISKKSVKLAMGSTKTLKIKNKKKNAKIKWKSSNKKVVTVSKKGKLKAKKTGTATVTAKVAGKKFQCKVKVYKPVGTKKYPADPKKGYTVNGQHGKFYFKLDKVYKNQDAVDKMYNPDRRYNYYEQNKNNTKDLILLEWTVKSVSGYEDTIIFSGSDVFNTYSTYENDCKTIFVEGIYWGIHDLYDKIPTNIKLYNGDSSKMYKAFYVPGGKKSFMSMIYDKSKDNFWVKYDL